VNLNQLTVKQAREGFLSKKFSPQELYSDCLIQIKKLEPSLNAFVSINDKIPDNIDIYKPLGGIPIAVKDNFLIENGRTTASAKLLDQYHAHYTATVVQKLLDAGAVIIGKTNMDAWAHGSSTETSDYGPTKNPWNTNHLPGGSSGGSATATAADECLASIGSETAGSVRQPAAWCGVVGFKPTYGRCSRYGLIAMKSSTDSPGPITKTVNDAAYLLSIISGYDPRDATSIEGNPWTIPPLLPNIKKIKIGLPLSYFPPQIQPEVKKAVLASAYIFKKLGAEVVELPDVLDPKYSVAIYTILQRSEVSSNLSRFDGIRYGRNRSYFSAEAKRRIMLGTYSLSAGYYDAYYTKAQKVRTILCQDFDKQFAKVDAIIGPTSPTTALPLKATEGQAMFGELQDMFLEPSSIAGLAGISIPCGFDDQKLPIGLTIVAPQKHEDIVYQLAKTFEDNTDYHLQKPKLLFDSH
jgi:aspartyl-tRNA(Asn)/glutamyl-tRNA(Gln) amidotransferase subunit A